MSQQRIIECVPNFSEGRNPEIIRQITEVISATEGVKLLNVDPGKATNRTVVTFAGAPEHVVEAAFRAIQLAAELIDMSQHKGEHPRMGATDVCPLVPISGVSMEEAAEWARKLGERVGNELGIPVYLYEEAQPQEYRKNLSVIRAGEYEGFFEKISQPEWKPDFGPALMNAKTGATVIGARDFLIAYNVNLNTRSTRLANRIAFDVREAGRVKREGNPYSGKIMKDEQGEPIRIPGSLKAVKAIGWYIEEYGIAQISMNLTNFRVTPLHVAFEETVKKAGERGIRVTGSELVGLVPLNAMLEAGRYFLEKQEQSTGVSETELIHIAIRSMGLDELGPFEPEKRIIEFVLKEKADTRLVDIRVRDFADETASNSPAPGGGSIAALAGALGASLGAMVANLSADKRGWEDRVKEFSPWAEKGQAIKDRLLFLVDEDTRAFDGVLEAMRLPKDTDEEKAYRKEKMEAANQYAAQVPYEVIKTAAGAVELLGHMAEYGNPNSISDSMVGLLCIKTAIRGAFYNVLINGGGLGDRDFAERILADAEALYRSADEACNAILEKAEAVLRK